MTRQRFINGRICARAWAITKNNKDQPHLPIPQPHIGPYSILTNANCTSLYFGSHILNPSDYNYLYLRLETQDLNLHFPKALIIAITIYYCKDPRKAMLKFGDCFFHINYVKVLIGMVNLSMLRLKRSYIDNWLLFSFI